MDLEDGLLLRRVLLVVDEKVSLLLLLSLGSWILRSRIINGYSERCNLGLFLFSLSLLF